MIPWFRLDDIRENGQVLNNSIRHVTPAAIRGKINKANYLIIATTATIGVHALITVDSIANQQFTILNLNDNYHNKFNIKFLYYYFFKVDEYCLKILKNGAY
ncbi:restriction endonuclease subunit S [bacterium]|nr:restriction endonuclease subunit S [bacterium]